MTETATPIDNDAIRRKYREERDKRLRPDGNDQYLELKDQLAHYLEDPYTPITPREPVTDHVTVAIIGGGFAGLVTGARLKEAGIDDVRIIEKAGDFGGTWYWNRYPGAQCDTASMIYLPLLEETGHIPSEKYVHGPEILSHSQNIARGVLDASRGGAAPRGAGAGPTFPVGSGRPALIRRSAPFSSTSCQAWRMARSRNCL